MKERGKKNVIHLSEYYGTTEKTGKVYSLVYIPKVTLGHEGCLPPVFPNRWSAALFIPVCIFFTSVTDKLFPLQSHNCFQIDQLIISQT
jgi:hypothetical protein